MKFTIDFHHTYHVGDTTITLLGTQTKLTFTEFYTHIQSKPTLFFQGDITPKQVMLLIQSSPPFSQTHVTISISHVLNTYEIKDQIITNKDNGRTFAFMDFYQHIHSQPSVFLQGNLVLAQLMAILGGRKISFDNLPVPSSLLRACMSTCSGTKCPPKQRIYKDTGKFRCHPFVSQVKPRQLQDKRPCSGSCSHEEDIHDIEVAKLIMKIKSEQYMMEMRKVSSSSSSPSLICNNEKRALNEMELKTGFLEMESQRDLPQKQIPPSPSPPKLLDMSLSSSSSPSTCPSSSSLPTSSLLHSSYLQPKTRLQFTLDNSECVRFPLDGIFLLKNNKILVINPSSPIGVFIQCDLTTGKASRLHLNKPFTENVVNQYQKNDECDDNDMLTWSIKRAIVLTNGIHLVVHFMANCNDRKQDKLCIYKINDNDSSIEFCCLVDISEYPDEFYFHECLQLQSCFLLSQFSKEEKEQPKQEGCINDVINNANKDNPTRLIENVYSTKISLVHIINENTTTITTLMKCPRFMKAIDFYNGFMILHSDTETVELIHYESLQLYGSFKHESKVKDKLNIHYSGQSIIINDLKTFVLFNTTTKRYTVWNKIFGLNNSACICRDDFIISNQITEYGDYYITYKWNITTGNGAYQDRTCTLYDYNTLSDGTALQNHREFLTVL